MASSVMVLVLTAIAYNPESGTVLDGVWYVRSIFIAGTARAHAKIAVSEVVRSRYWPKNERSSFLKASAVVVMVFPLVRIGLALYTVPETVVHEVVVGVVRAPLGTESDSLVAVVDTFDRTHKDRVVATEDVLEELSRAL